ncbi:DUF2207 domain-containing protein [Amycolatopsis sp. NPDC051372]|uniref:DUF2207 domain-containing protein n=1 Tax=Amycolatopsis sp. NPDC051372 TaxID=3155669 RepID=UPI00342347BA
MLLELATALAGLTADVTATAHPDGSVTVTEQVTTATPATHRIALRVATTDDEDRVYTVRDARLTGSGHLDEDSEGLVATYTGPATLSYTVDGAVADGGQLRWQVTGGWDADLIRLTTAFSAPGISAVDCYAGAIGSARHCTFSELGAGGIARVEQDGLRRGERVDLAVDIPPGALPVNARFVAVSPVADFFKGPGIPVLALVLLLIAAVPTWLHRRRGKNRFEVLSRG